MMGGVAFGPWKAGPQVGTPDIEHPLVPVAAPLSVGVPPFAPGLVMGLSIEANVRSVNDTAGYRVTSGKPGRVPCRVEVVWDFADRDDRDTLLAWLLGSLRVGSEGSELAFDLDLDLAVDGPGGSVMVVRAAASPREEQVGLNAWRVSVACVEVING